MDTEKLLALLSDGNFKSGVFLAESLAVSRTTVWKALNELKEVMGLHIEKVKGKGYRLKGGLALLDRQVMEAELCNGDFEKGLQLTFFNTIGSTNEALMSSASHWSSKSYQVALAEMQTAGRGRRGKFWVSPFAKNIYMSIGFVFEEDVTRLEGLSLVVGLAVARVLSGIGVEGVEVKWPNDIYINGRKVGGILVELAGEFNSQCFVVVGLGLNVDMDDLSVEDIDQPWTSLKKEGMTSSRSKLAIDLIKSLITEFEQFFECGLRSYVEQWVGYDYLLGKEVEVLGQGLVGIASGIDGRGCLLINVNGEMKSINAGEVSVRLSSIAN